MEVSSVPHTSSDTIPHSFRLRRFNNYLLGVHDMQQASRKAEPGDYKHAVNK